MNFLSKKLMANIYYSKILFYSVQVLQFPLLIKK